MATIATHSPPQERRTELPVVALASAVLVLVVAGAFAAGWLIGRILS